MSYTNKSKSELTLADVNKILDYSLNILKYEISNDISIEKIYTETFKLNCFKDKILQVFISILKNSVDSLNVTGFNGSKVVKIETKYEIESDKKCGLIIVSNSGPHIPDEILSQIFDPFFTTKNPDDGTGLGLTTSYNIIKEHKGSIIVRNTSKGVETLIRIPV
jgi:signal transduction histidine kinase